MQNLDSDDSNTLPDATNEHALVAAAQRVAADVDAVRDEELQPVNRDIAAVVATVGAAYKIAQKHMPALEKLGDVDIARIRKLGDYTAALLYFSAQSSTVVPPKPELAGMIERGFILRERTLHDLRSIANHGLIPAARLEHLSGNTIYRKVGHDLVAISALVHEYWTAIEGKTLITLAAMDEAMTLGTAIIDAIGDRELAQAEQARDLVRRNKAYTLVLHTYDELRDALAFVRRREGDAEKLAPSLFGGRRAGKKEDEVLAAMMPGAGAPKMSSLIVPDDTP